MATKRRRVKKRRRSNRKQRGGEAPKNAGEKFKLNKNFGGYWSTVVNAMANNELVLGDVAANTEVTWTGSDIAGGENKGKYVMKVEEGKFILAGEDELAPTSGIPQVSPPPPAAALDTRKIESLVAQMKTNWRCDCNPKADPAAGTTQRGPAAGANPAAATTQRGPAAGANPAAATGGGKKRRKTKRSHKKRPHKKRRTKKRR